MKLSKEIRTENTVFRLQENGIIESRLLNDELERFSLEEVEEFVEGMHSLCENEPYPMVSVMGDVHITDEGRKHILDNMRVSMAALVGSTFVARIMANLLINFKPLPIPVKLFDDEASAYAWIQEMQRKQALKRQKSSRA
ncbi:MAG: STAS/SEC14 domain-containing protein [Flavobacteriales bacterium]|nr:STAS/SEC14 domain-containing protein [Flavobacteriales bacterium]